MLQMKRHRPFTLSYCLVFSLFSFGLLLLANLPGSIAASFRPKEKRFPSNNVLPLPSSLSPPLDELSAVEGPHQLDLPALHLRVIDSTVPPPPSSTPSCPVQILELQPQTQTQPGELSEAVVSDAVVSHTVQTQARVNGSSNDEEEEWPKPADIGVIVAVFTSCITLVNTIPTRDTIHSPILYYAYMAFLFLSFFTILGPFGS